MTDDAGAMSRDAITRTADSDEVQSRVQRAVAAIAAGGLAVVTDDVHRENEADLIMAADAATPEALGFMIRYGSGIVCVSVTPEQADRLRLPPMTPTNSDPRRTAFTVSVDHRHGTTTGISARDRAKTIRALADLEATAEMFNRPGHVFPLRYTPGGVLKRAGHTEAALDLARMAGRAPAGALCEIVNDDGTVATGGQVRSFADRHRLPLVSIADIVRFRNGHERLVKRVGEARMPTTAGLFRAIAFRDTIRQEEHVALVAGELGDGERVLVRVHSECLTGDSFGSLRCDCAAQLDLALAKVAQAGRGVVVYLRGHEGRGLGLGHKLRAYELQDLGHDTVAANIVLGFPADSREYGIGAQILRDLGVRSMRLMTNNPAKYHGLEGYGLSIVERVSHVIAPTPDNVRYLMTKQSRLGHLLGLQSEPQSHGG